MSKQEAEKKKILYLCDREKCADCSYPICRHTEDINHAKNFKCIKLGAFGYIEKENENANH